MKEWEETLWGGEILGIKMELHGRKLMEQKLREDKVRGKTSYEARQTGRKVG